MEPLELATTAAARRRSRSSASDSSTMSIDSRASGVSSTAVCEAAEHLSPGFENQNKHFHNDTSTSPAPISHYVNRAVAEAHLLQDSGLASLGRLLRENRFTPANRVLVSAAADDFDGHVVPSCAVLPLDDGVTRQALFAQGTGVGVSLAHLPAEAVIPQLVALCREPQRMPDGRTPGIMATLPWRHPAAEAFVNVKRRPLKWEELKNVNISLVVPLTEMEAFLNSSIGEQAVNAALACGDPGLVFSDDPTQATVPCGELWLEPYEACTLGVVNLAEHVSPDNPQLPNLELLRETLQLAIPAMDCLIDRLQLPANSPMPDVVARARRLGIGVAGWATVLDGAGVAYGSSEALALAKTWASAFAQAAHAADVDAAGQPIVRAGLLALPPTGNTAKLLKVSFAIEPPFDREPVSWQQHVDMLAVWQRQVDGAISKTVNLPNAATAADVVGTWRQAAAAGCRGITVFRDGCLTEHGNGGVGSSQPLAVVSPASRCTLNGSCG